MTIIIFGASGGTGTALIQKALGNGHRVKAFVRNSKKITIKHKNLSLIKGDIRNVSDVVNAVKGVDAVLYTIGSKPWQDPVCEIGIKQVIAAMKTTKAKRLIAQSAYGAKESKKGLYGHFLWWVIPKMLKDKNAMEVAIEKSGLEWTIIRPLMFIPGRESKKYTAGNISVYFWGLVSRKTVAAYTIEMLETHNNIHQKCSIFSWGF